MSSSTMPTSRSVNIGSRLTAMAKRVPDQLAVVMPWNDRRSRPRAGQTRSYRWVTFAELERDSNIVAAGLQRMGVKPGTRIVLLVRPGIEFVMLTFSLFKAGAVTILIDPGMGRQHLLDCLQQARPEGFVAIPLAHIARLLHRKRFPQARYFVTVGRRWGWGGTTLRRLMKGTTDGYRTVSTTAEDPAAIIFTSGSTGPPKGVLYRHGNFDTQVEEIRRRYDIQPGGRDLAGFPLFGLFNSAMGVTTIIPDMDASRPASVDPCKIVEAIEDWQIDQAFASPAVWNAVGRHCVDAKLKLPTLRRVLSAGAPVPTHVLRNLQETIAPDGEIWTPYGATESLPVASISARQVLSETAEKSATGAGTCVGTRFERIQWKVIRISDHPIATLADAEPLSRGQIGELIVRGPVVTTEYVTRTESNAWSKISDGDSFWHRMGDVGY
ncbi:MAG: AMP-binding protein, partial [Planctomycetales bacterium]|nr:AMP-binding protein [Planctomycetales bacterium]